MGKRGEANTHSQTLTHKHTTTTTTKEEKPNRGRIQKPCSFTDTKTKTKTKTTTQNTAEATKPLKDNLGKKRDKPQTPPRGLVTGRLMLSHDDAYVGAAAVRRTTIRPQA